MCSEKLLKTQEVKTRSTHPEGSCQEGVLENFAKFAGKHMCWSLFIIIKLTGWGPATLLERESSTGASAFCEYLQNLQESFSAPLGDHFWHNVVFFFFMDHGGLIKKEMQLNLCSILPILIFNEFYLFA